MDTASESSSSKMRGFEKSTHRISHTQIQKNIMEVGETTSKAKTPILQTPLLRLCIKSQDGDETYFKVRENQNIRSLLQIYCSSKQMEYKCVVFLHDGKTLRRRGTVAQVGLVDQDVIEAVVHQTGGGPIN